MNKLIDFTVKHYIAISAFVCVAFYFLPFKPQPFGDGEYHEGTIHLIEYILNGFQGDVRVDKGLFTLFYYLIPYATVYYFKKKMLFYASGVILNVIMTCFGINYLFKTFDLLKFPNQAKFWALVVLTLFPIHAYYAMGILSSPGAFFAVCMMIYLWVKIKKGDSSSNIDYWLLAFSITMLIGTRPNYIPFAFVFLIYFLAQKDKLKYKIFFTTSLICMTLLLHFTEKMISTNHGDFKEVVFRENLVWSRFELRNEPFNWIPQHGWDGFDSSDYRNNIAKRKELYSICDAQKLDKTDYFVKWAVNDIAHNPLLTVRQYFLKFFQAQSFIISPLIKSNKSNFIKYSVHIYINTINYILIFGALYGMYILKKNKEYELFFPFLLIWACSLIYVFIFHSEQRYMFPMRPVLIFLFAYSLSVYFKSKKLN